MALALATMGPSLEAGFMAAAPKSTTSRLGARLSRTIIAATSKAKWKPTSPKPRAGSFGISRPKALPSGISLGCWTTESSRTPSRLGNLVQFAPCDETTLYPHCRAGKGGNLNESIIFHDARLTSQTEIRFGGHK